MVKKRDAFDEQNKRWIGCPVEEEYFGHHRKETKTERKQAEKKDRSKYKKTDRDKFHQSIENDIASKMESKTLLEGRVLSINPQGMIVDCLGKQIQCKLRGLLKKAKTESKNLVIVGDFVLFEEIGDDEGVIVHVKPRYSVLSRADNLSRRKEQLIAANIDQVLITVSVVNPEIKSSLIDRYIIAAQKGNMQPVIVINKIDLLSSSFQDIAPERVKAEEELYTECLLAYKNLGIRVIAVSTKTGEGLDDLRQAMKDKASVFSGQSGVGKSSLINATADLTLRIGEVVEKTKKGSHTTTTAQLIPLPFGGWCIDTPGIKSFGVWDLQIDEIESYYSEIHDMGLHCKFPDCTHTHESHCAVQQAVEQGLISPLRFNSYQALMESISSMHRRR